MFQSSSNSLRIVGVGVRHFSANFRKKNNFLKTQDKNFSCYSSVSSLKKEHKNYLPALYFFFITKITMTTKKRIQNNKVVSIKQHLHHYYTHHDILQLRVLVGTQGTCRSTVNKFATKFLMNRKTVVTSFKGRSQK